MEGLLSPSGSLKQPPTRKSSSSHSQKDLCLISHQGSLSELDSALSLLKKTGGNVDQRNAFGLTPLHIATWRNHVPIVKRLLAAGADPDTRDGESGWSSLHRAVHFGHLAVASVLIQAGASLMLEDPRCRTPVDLLSGPVSEIVGKDLNSVVTEVFSWGSGTNYQLGTGNAHIQKLPGKVDAFQDSNINIIAASKFHSVAVGAKGELYTWGFGRGGRLGHPDFDIHSGQAAVITPRRVTLGLGSRRVKAVAAAKHHTVVATESGEVFTWGSNREGQLGYTSVDTQSTPRRVGSLKVKIIAVAAANKHTAAVADSGEVFTWGCNKEGQLGYGTSNSASNYTPRLVEYLKGKAFVGVSAAKYHTIVLGSDGEVFTWGHRLVTPRRVVVARSLRKSGNAPLKFHCMERLHVVSVAAGVIQSTALTDDGSLFFWVSADPDLRCQQLYSFCGRNVVSISAGKYWTAAVTSTGDVYMWDAKRNKDESPVPTRLHGVKHTTSVCVGETHLLVLCSLYHPSYPTKSSDNHVKPVPEENDELEELDDGFIFTEIETNKTTLSTENDGIEKNTVPSLKSICERVAAECLVEPRNVIQFLEVADCLEAHDLRRHCEEIAIRNLDYILTVSAPSFVNASAEILAKLEKALDAKSSEAWCHRRLPTITATYPAIIDSEEERDGEIGYLRRMDNHKRLVLEHSGDAKTDCFLQTDSTADQVVFKQVRALRKKLQQIDMLEAKQIDGHLLDDQQIAKLQTRSALEGELAVLGFPLEKEPRQLSSPVLSNVKRNKKEGCRKQRRTKTNNAEQCDNLAVDCEDRVVENPVKQYSNFKIRDTSIEKEEVEAATNREKKITEESSFNYGEGSVSLSNQKVPQINSSKKKNRKGGLSMFLSGALDDAPHSLPPPPTPKSEGPAWGTTKITKGLASLRDIQNEQSKIKEITSIRPKDQHGNALATTGSAQITLSSFLPSSPIAMAPSRSVQSCDGEKSTPPWSTSPVSCRPSLRDIQMQQGKKQQSLSHSPKTKALGFLVPSHGSPSEASGPKDAAPSRWYRPETDAPSSLRSIQIEEKAMKDLKRFYSSVKLKTEPRTS